MKASADLAGSGCIEALVDTKIQPSSITAILAGFESLGWKRQRRLGRKQEATVGVMGEEEGAF